MRNIHQSIVALNLPILLFNQISEILNSEDLCFQFPITQYLSFLNMVKKLLVHTEIINVGYLCSQKILLKSNSRKEEKMKRK